MQDLKGMVALVTGASRGIGKGIALALGRAGVEVAVNFRANAAEAQAVAEAIRAAGARAAVIAADVSQSRDIERMIRETNTALGPIAILVNNAGILGSL